MISFKTQYDSHDRIHLNPGNRIKIVYSSRYTDRGVLELYESDRENLYDYIQSHADSVDIHLLLKRFAAGETDVLSKAQGFYLDASGMPKTYAEVLNSVLAGEQAFDSLPADVKQRFGNSFSSWMSSFEDADFLEKMGLVSQTPDSASPGLSNAQVQDFSGVRVDPNSVIQGGDSK